MLRGMDRILPKKSRDSDRSRGCRLLLIVTVSNLCAQGCKLGSLRFASGDGLWNDYDTALRLCACGVVKTDYRAAPDPKLAP